MRSSKNLLVLAGIALVPSLALFLAMIFAGIDDCDDMSRTSSGHDSSPPVVTASVPCNPSMHHASTQAESLSVVSSQEVTIVEEMTDQVQQVAPPSNVEQAGSVPESHLEYWSQYGQDAYNDALRDLLVKESNQTPEESSSGKP
jgi:hypothetical protein